MELCSKQGYRRSQRRFDAESCSSQRKEVSSRLSMTCHRAPSSSPLLLLSTVYAPAALSASLAGLSRYLDFSRPLLLVLNTILQGFTQGQDGLSHNRNLDATIPLREAPLRSSSHRSQGNIATNARKAGL